MSELDLKQKMQELELIGKFDEHISPIDYDAVIPLDKFHYIKTFKDKVKIFFQKLFIINPFIRKLNRKTTQTIVFGRENLKGIKSAILTCNHVFMFDCLVATHALRGHKLRITAAPFNNKKGFLGEMMRGGGLLPFGDNFENMKRFNNALEHYLSHNNYVLFYPEQAMWYMYDKPRPFKNGAFHYAVKHNVPVIPLFITYRNSEILNENGVEIKYFTIHIMKPLYPKKEFNKQENIDYLRDADYEMCKNKYEEVYGKKLEFLTKKS